MSTCPQCGSNRISVSETPASRTHTCNSCGYSETQDKPKGRAAHVGRFYAAAFLAVFALAVVLTLWAGGAA